MDFGENAVEKPMNSKFKTDNEIVAAGGAKGQESVLRRSSGVYARLIGRKPGTTEASSIAVTPSVRDKIVNFFARDSADVRLIRSYVKSYKTRLALESQTIAKANAKHNRRVADQFGEFKKQEKQLSSWGLKFAIPAFRMQAWVRLSRSALLEELSAELQTVIDERFQQATFYLRQFEEAAPPLRAEKYSVRGAEEFCAAPEALLDGDAYLAAKCKRLLRLDMQCNHTTKRFRQFEADFAWKDQTARKAVLLDILHRYKQLPQPDQLTNLETDLSWGDFCDWYAARGQRQSELEAEFCDFVEDQREKEGRLFFRWCAAMMRGQTPPAGAAPSSSAPRKPSFSSQPEPQPPMSDLERLNSHVELQMDVPAAPATPPPEPGPGQPAMPSPQGLVALKMTPSSTKAFIQYFANDVIGVQYGIPRDCLDANVALTEALFYRRIHSHVLKYASAEQRAKDERWRLQCQLCRFVDPLSYHVPASYLGSPDATRETSAAFATPPRAAAPVTPIRDSNPSSVKLDSVFAGESLATEVVVEAPSNGNRPADAIGAAQVAGPPSAAVDSQSQPRGGLMEALTWTPTPAAVPSLEAASVDRTEPRGLRRGMLSSGSAPSCLCRNCQTFTHSSRLKRLARFSEGQFGQAYARSSRVLSLIATAMTPKEVMLNLSLAYKWLLRDAIDASGSRSTIGADLLVPLFTLVVITAQIPNIHLMLGFLLDYGVYDEQGDVSYSIANLEGSVLFVTELAVAEEARARFESSDACRSITSSFGAKQAARLSTPLRAREEDGAAATPPPPAGSTPSRPPAPPASDGKPRKGSRSSDASVDEDYQAMAQLGEWLRDQQTMEDTITILQKDGWMA